MFYMAFDMLKKIFVWSIKLKIVWFIKWTCRICESNILNCKDVIITLFLLVPVEWQIEIKFKACILLHSLFLLCCLYDNRTMSYFTTQNRNYAWKKVENSFLNSFIVISIFHFCEMTAEWAENTLWKWDFDDIISCHITHRKGICEDFCLEKCGIFLW